MQETAVNGSGAIQDQPTAAAEPKEGGSSPKLVEPRRADLPLSNDHVAVEVSAQGAVADLGGGTDAAPASRRGSLSLAADPSAQPEGVPGGFQGLHARSDEVAARAPELSVQI